MVSTILAVAVREHCACCWVGVCEDEGQNIIMPSSGDTSCMSGTLYQSNHSYSQALSDCLVFWSKAGANRTAAIELKSGPKNMTRAWRQLQNGADLIDALAATFGDVDFSALLVAPELDPMAHRVLGRKTVQFRGVAEYPRWVAAGSSLASAIS